MEKKKLIKGMAFVFGALLLVGCGEKENEEKKTEEKKEDVKLVCSMEEEGQKMSYVFTFDHKKENMKSGQMLMELEIPEEEDSSELEDLDLCGLFTSEDDEESKMFKDCKSTKKDSTYTMTIDLDLDEMEKASKDEENPFKKDMSLKEVQDSITKDEENMVCEVK